MITRQQKEQLVEEITAKIKDSKSLVFADYRGLTVEEMTDLRRQLRAKGVELKVLKQTLFNIAAKKAGADIDMSAMKDHPVAIAFAKDEVEGAKVIYDFNKKTDKLEMVGGALAGKSVSLDELKALATMPSREEMYAKIVGSLASPLRGVVNVLQGNLRGLVNVLNQVAEAKK